MTSDHDCPIDHPHELEEEVRRAVEESKDLHDTVSFHVSRTSAEEQSHRRRTASLDSDIRRRRSGIETEVGEGNSLFARAAENLEEDLQRAGTVLADGDASSFLPVKPQASSVKMAESTFSHIKLPLREDRTALLFLLFPSTLLLGCMPAFPVQLYQVDISSLLCAMAMALVSLTWEIRGEPNCASKLVSFIMEANMTEANRERTFLQWAIMQGVAMLLQNGYQRQKLYTRIALGKAMRRDVVWDKTAGVDGQLWLLCPILFAMQGFEAYVGLLFLKTAMVGVIPEWQVIMCVILRVLMAVGNFTNTVHTLMAKSRFNAKMKRTKSKHEFD